LLAPKLVAGGEGIGKKRGLAPFPSVVLRGERGSLAREQNRGTLAAPKADQFIAEFKSLGRKGAGIKASEAFSTKANCSND
jgi:hypothetical protein